MTTSGEVRSYRDLVLWQRAMELVDIVYPMCRSLPKEETFGLRSQLSRAVVSVPCNIAEGHGRMSSREFAYFVRIARGSLYEVRTLLEILERNGFAEKAVVKRAMDVADQIGGMTHALLSKLRP